MNGEHGWDPESLGRLTMAQFNCLLSKEAPGDDKPLGSFEEFEAKLREIEAEEREWRSPP